MSDNNPASSDEEGLVTGTVRDGEGLPLHDVRVTLFVKQFLGAHKELTSASTDRDGRFSLQYARVTSAPSLFLRVRRGDGFTVDSPVIIQASATERLDVIADPRPHRGPSLFHSLRERLEAPLREDGLAFGTLVDFEPEDVAYLAVRTSVDPDDILVVRHALALENQLGLPAELFFGMARQGISRELDDILAAAPSVRRRALDAAYEARQVSSESYAHAEELLDKLDDKAREAVLEIPDDPSQMTLGALFEKGARLDPEQSSDLLNLYRETDGPIERFWKHAYEGFDTDVVDRAKFALHLGSLVEGYLPMVTYLVETMNIRSIDQLGAFTQKDWEGHVGKAGMPPVLAEAGVTPEQYAEAIYSSLEESFPTEVLRKQLDRFPRPDLTRVFFENHPGFDLRSTSLVVYLRDKEIGGSEPEETKRRLLAMESIYRIAPRGRRIETMEVLLGAGMDSPAKIRAMGKASFCRKLEGKLEQEEAETIFARASQATALATLLQLRHGSKFERTGLQVIVPPPAVAPPGEEPEFPDLPTFFGGSDFCSCEDCQSMLSPAAYLFDLLQWLEGRAAKGGKSAYDILVDRRPDLPRLQLSCRNTHTPVPYIDLVNETLELAVAPTRSPISYQTEGDEEDLAVQPENRLDAAYEKLSGDTARDQSVYPFILPFDLWAHETRWYLELLGMQREALVDQFGDEGVDGLNGADLENLQLTPFAAQVITRSPDLREIDEHDFWGMGPDYVEKLANVGSMLRQASPNRKEPLPFDMLLDLFRASYVQGSQPSKIRFANSSCQTSEATIEPLEDAQLTRMDQLLRLHIRLGMSAHELDAAIQAFGGSVDEGFLAALADVRRLKGKLRLETLPLLSFWADIDTRRWNSRMVSVADAEGAIEFRYVPGVLDPRQPEEGAASFYEKIFLSRSVHGATSLPTALLLNDEGDELSGRDEPILDHIPALSAALDLSEAELAPLLHSVLADGAKLTLHNVSQLYRHVTLARSLGLDVPDLLSFIDLIGIDPFAAPADSVRFVDAVQEVQRGSFTLHELNYLLRNIDTEPATLGLKGQEIGLILHELRSVLQSARGSLEAPTDLDSLVLDEMRRSSKEALIAVLGEKAAMKALAIFDRVQAEPVEEHDADVIFLRARCGILFPDVERAIVVLLRGGKEELITLPEDRFRYLLPPLLDARARVAVATQFFAATFDLPSSSAAALLRDFAKLRLPGGETRRGLDIVLDWSFLGPEPGLEPEAEYPAQVRYLRFFDKLARVIDRLALAVEHFPWVFVKAPKRGIIDLRELPVDEPTTADFAGWTRLVRAASLQSNEFDGSLFDLFFDANTAASASNGEDSPWDDRSIRVEIAERTGWSLEDLNELCDHFGINYPYHFRDEVALARVSAGVATIRKTGLKLAALLKLAKTAKTSSERKEQAEIARQAARSRTVPSEWLRVARPIRDELRERQRDALGAWLIAHSEEPFASYADLYDHYLLDVEMSACAATSRIRLALSSVQLLVQRSLMGLEPVRLSPADSKEWEPLSRYRVWEANRKILLYPENWLDPELRDDKTPFFKELEQELLQSDLDSEAIDGAVANYLAKLVEVSKLEVVGYEVEFEERKTKGENPIYALPFEPTVRLEHVIARTPGRPHRYFYRRRLQGQAWTPWEPIHVDIVGDQILPVIFQGVLHLFWLNIQSKEGPPAGGIRRPPAEPSAPKENGADPKPDDTVQEAVPFNEFRLEWSTFRRNSWSPKRTSQATLTDLEIRSSRHPAAGAGEAPDRSFTLVSTANNDKVLRLAIAFEASGVFAEEVPPDQHKTELYLVGRSFVYHGNNHVQVEEVSGTEFPRVLYPKREPGLVGQSLAHDGKFLLPSLRRATRSWFALDVFRMTPSRYLCGPISSLHADYRQNQLPPPLLFYSDSEHAFYFESHVEAVRPYVEDLPRLDDIPVAGGGFQLDIRPDVGPFLGYSLRIVDAPGKFERLPLEGSDLLSTIVNHGFGHLGIRSSLVVGREVPEQPPRSLGATVTYMLDQGHTFISRSQGQHEGQMILGVQLRNGSDQITDTRPRALSTQLASNSQPVLREQDFKVSARPFSHPFASLLLQEVTDVGLLQVLRNSDRWVRQRLRKDVTSTYHPSDRVNLPIQSIELDFEGAFSIYNWEIFLHIPLLIVNLLGSQRKFDRARDWLHCIFDPTSVVDEEEPIQVRHWRFRPFAEVAEGQLGESSEIEQLRAFLYGGDEAEAKRTRASVAAQVAQWRRNPFSPHAVARLRQSSYMRHVLMSYIANLLEWGDELFREDTIESIGEASSLYLLAARLLGARPVGVEVRSGPAPTYLELAHGEVPADWQSTFGTVEAQGAENPAQPFEELPLLPWSFCAPPNQRLVTDFWGRVADRLFKVRHCLNIEGVYRELELFDPPIDPGLLARARAAGLDLGAVLRESRAPVPSFRFRHLHQKALELVTDVIALGAGLLSALEKQDAERLQVLRAGHQTRIQRAMLSVLEGRVEEAQETLEGLKRSKDSVAFRAQFYRSRTFRNAQEARQEDSLTEAQIWTMAAEGISLAISILGSVPTATAGAAGWASSPLLLASSGSEQALSPTQAITVGARMRASYMTHVASLAGISAAHIRRKEDWDFQAELADRELEGLEKQILAAEIRLAIAEKEVENQELQMRLQAEEQALLETKFTNAELYGWLASQTSSLYFQSYQLAYDLAKKAERAWQFDLGLPERSFITHGHWDGLKKGLLAGEKLRFELRQMDVAYLDNRKRELELSMSLSLRDFAPDRLAELKISKSCELSITEDDLDRDCPGLYMRRIRSVALTIPSVTGPHTPIRCSLTLEKSWVRFTPNSPPNSTDDPGLRQDHLGIRSIVTSRGERDTGLFEAGSSDDRYSPFEGAGAISNWRLELPESESFDYSTISDVVIEVQYTALDGGETLRQAAQERLMRGIAADGFSRGYDLRSLVPDEAQRFLDPTSRERQAVEVPLNEDDLPRALLGMNPRVRALTIVLHRRGPMERDLDLSRIALRVDGVRAKIDRLDAEGGTILHAHVDYPAPFGGKVAIEVDADLPPDHPLVVDTDGVRRLLIDEMVLVVHGGAEVPKGGRLS